ncbi:hypothetical protein bsdE14_40450 [Clostridium omnivorum]|uniref:Uncharacterized protein n=1 Tax=Clostridium omnivorum TaxID=1604902 RepID=A0ABQ5NC80_9CLOT|nr:hypothetical protein bsdE14_40450 [Clostridium sp. E14]
MKLKKITNLIIIILSFCFIIGIGAFIYNSVITYKINKDFKSIPLQFNADDSSSTYHTQNSQITIYGGFVKGIQKDKNNIQKTIY